MTSISAPTSLATFQNARASSSKLPHVALSGVSGSEGALALAAISGEGVWTYDLVTLRPTTSFAAPPSTTFSTPALSFIPEKPAPRPGKEKQTKKDGAEVMDVDASQEDMVAGQRRVTMVAVRAGEGVTPGKAGRTIWCWTGEDDAEKKVIELDSKGTVQALLELRDKRNSVLIVTDSAELFFLDADLAVQAVPILGLSERERRITASAITGIAAHSSDLTMVTKDAHVLLARLDYTSDGVTARVVSERALVEGDRKVALRSASVSTTGSISALDTSLRVYHTSAHTSSTIAAPSCPRFTDAASSPATVSLPAPGRPVALTAVNGASPALLVATLSPELPAAIAETSLGSLPTSGPVSGLAVLATVSPSTFTVGFVVSHASSTPEDATGRSVIYTCDVNLPSGGVGLKDLLGSGAATARYFVVPKTVHGAAPGDVRGQRFLAQLRSILEESGDDRKTVEQATKLWLERFSPDGAKAGGKVAESAVLTPAFAKATLELVFGVLPPDAKTDNVSVSVDKGPYASAIVADLLDRGLVDDEMLPGGVILGALLPLRDWPNIFRGLRMPSLSPATIITLLQTVARLSETPDSPSPEIREVLETVLALPAPVASYRAELRRLLDVEVAAELLLHLAEWAEYHMERSTITRGWDEGNVEGSKRGKVPELEAVITHASLLLDSHLPLFLSHAPSYDHLARLQAALEPQLAMQTQLRKLRAPIEAVLALSKEQERQRDERDQKNATRHKMSAAKEGEPKAKKGGKGGKGAKGKKGVVFVEDSEGSVLPGEAMGKWRVEEIYF